MTIHGKRIVMLAGDGPLTRIVYHALRERLPITHVILEAPGSRGELLRRRINKLGWRKVGGQVLFSLLAARWLKLTSQQRIAAIRAEHHLNDSPIDAAVVRAVPSVNSAETIRLLQDLQPDVVLVNGTRIISAEVLAAVPAPFINTHAGITPRYRGVHGGYWACVERNPAACGVTVHRVDRGIDTGGILAQALIEPTAQDNFTTYPWLQIAAALPLLERVLTQSLEGLPITSPARKQPRATKTLAKSKLWSHPTLGEYLWYRLRHGVR